MTKRATIIVLDSVGIGAMPDYKQYNDPPNCNTLGNVAKHCQGLSLPNLADLGLGYLGDFQGIDKTPSPTGSYGKMAEKAPGKDTSTGHWELTGAILEKPLSLFPEGFPEEIIQPFIEKTGRGVVGNKAASGTVIIDELASQQQETGSWIVYTSADSVFQVAAHEEWIPLEELYKACEIARELLEPYFVGRVIARPFLGSEGSYTRTANRKDYALDPPAKTVLDVLVENGISVTGVGKIGNIFNMQGITDSYPTKSNKDGIDKTCELMETTTDGLLFVNLVDFDSKFGHRNNPKGYGEALEYFDTRLPDILSRRKKDELLIITADHGCDPTVPGTDHSREYVPLLVCSSQLTHGTNLGTRSTFADVAETLTDFWSLEPLGVGSSLFSENKGS